MHYNSVLIMKCWTQGIQTQSTSKSNSTAWSHPRNWIWSTKIWWSTIIPKLNNCRGRIFVQSLHGSIYVVWATTFNLRLFGSHCESLAYDQFSGSSNPLAMNKRSHNPSSQLLSHIDFTKKSCPPLPWVTSTGLSGLCLVCHNITMLMTTYWPHLWSLMFILVLAW